MIVGVALVVDSRRRSLQVVFVAVMTSIAIIVVTGAQLVAPSRVDVLTALVALYHYGKS